MRLRDITDGIEKTAPLYLEDPYAKASQGNLLRFIPDGKKDIYIVLDRTIYHPKGGGQPSDKGLINGKDFEINIKKAINVGGIVVHCGKLLNGKIKAGPVRCEVDWERRYLFMRRHTANHLLDHCLATVTGTPTITTELWLGDPCYVGYSGKPPSNNLIKETEKIANNMININANVNVENVSYAKLLELAPQAPNIHRLPMLKTYRVVTIQGCSPIPCAGTHVKTIKEIGYLIIEKVETEGPGYRIYFDVM